MKFVEFLTINYKYTIPSIVLIVSILTKFFSLIKRYEWSEVHDPVSLTGVELASFGFSLFLGYGFFSAYLKNGLGEADLSLVVWFSQAYTVIFVGLLVFSIFFYRLSREPNALLSKIRQQCKPFVKVLFTVCSWFCGLMSARLVVDILLKV